MNQNVGEMIMQIVPLLLLITVVVVATFLPQRKRDKQVKQMLDEMKKGDWVRTALWARYIPSKGTTLSWKPARIK